MGTPNFQVSFVLSAGILGTSEGASKVHVNVTRTVRTKYLHFCARSCHWRPVESCREREREREREERREEKRREEKRREEKRREEKRSEAKRSEAKRSEEQSREEKSREEQSRAEKRGEERREEQSRAEQSREEKSRAEKRREEQRREEKRSEAKRRAEKRREEKSRAEKRREERRGEKSRAEQSREEKRRAEQRREEKRRAEQRGEERREREREREREEREREREERERESCGGKEKTGPLLGVCIYEKTCKRSPDQLIQHCAVQAQSYAAPESPCKGFKARLAASSSTLRACCKLSVEALKRMGRIAAFRSGYPGRLDKLGFSQKQISSSCSFHQYPAISTCCKTESQCIAASS